MKELVKSELINVNGGDSFAYRVGQGIRYLIYGSMPNGAGFIIMKAQEIAWEAVE